MSRPAGKRSAEEEDNADEPRQAKKAKDESASSAVETIQLPDGKRYTGQVNESREPHGSGTKFRADGSEEASGQWRNGKMNGRGKMIHANGGCYKGDFVDGKKIGLGTFTWADGSVYEGELDDAFSGLGVYWDKKGKVDACGRWAANVLVEDRPVPRSKIPIGTLLSAAAKLADLICPGGGHYCGALNGDNEPHGAGTLFRADGSEAARGDWIGGRLWVSGSVDAQGRLQGAASEWSAIGLFEGNFVDGQRSGLGKLTWNAGGDVHVGEFISDKLEGFGVRIKNGAVVRCGRWENGRLAESRPVPRSKLIDDSMLSAAARAADPSRTLLLPNGGHYVGEFNADFRQHGEGVEFRANGSEVASGEWRDGKPLGRGKMILSNGECYEGNFVDGKFSGLGTYTWADGKMYEGEFSKGDFNGFGVQWSAGGKVVACGRWVDDEVVKSCPVPLNKIPTGVRLSAAVRAADPDSVLLLPHGGHFEGDFNADFQPHGEGTEYDADGSEAASGQWRDGKMHGHGKMNLPQGSRYEGDFVDEEFSGLGTYTWASGSAYEGEWAADKRSGLGVQWDRDADSMRCGRWADEELVESCAVPRNKLLTGLNLSAAAKLADLICPGGGHYCGSLDDGIQPHGVGTLFCADGSEAARGDWAGGRMWVSGSVDAQDRLQGVGSEWSVFGLYVGNFIDGQCSGLGALTSLDGSQFEGEWAEGKRNGLGIQWDKDRTVIGCGRWADDKLEEERPVPRSKVLVGEFISASAKAAPPERTLLLPCGGHYVGECNANFKPHGKGIRFCADGSEQASGQWRDGHMHDRGKMIFPGGILYEGDFIDDQMSGLGTLTWAHGEVYEGEWTEDRRGGFGVLWDKDAKVLKCGRWAKDQLVEARSVPRSKMPAGTIRNAAANDAALLYPNGGFYRGEINARFQRHGKGSVHSADGAVRACDSWQEDQLADLGVGDAAAAVGGHSTGAVGGLDGKNAHLEVIHFCLCMDCAAKVHRCPLCRTPITGREEKRVVPIALIPPRAGAAAGPPAAVATAAAASTVSASTAASGAHGPGPAAVAVGSGLAESAAVPAASPSSAVAAATSAMAVNVERAAADSAAPPAASPRASNGDVAACAVCRSAPPDSIIDCPHFCLCMECAAHTDRCPICAVVITRRDQRRIIFS